jgi:hypothetical protein
MSMRELIVDRVKLTLDDVISLIKPPGLKELVEGGREREELYS